MLKITLKKNLLKNKDNKKNAINKVKLSSSNLMTFYAKDYMTRDTYRERN